MRMSSAEFVALNLRMQAKKKTDNLAAAIAKCDKSESTIQNEIENHLKSLGTSCWFTRSRMDKATTQRVGVPDFLAIISGKAFALEVKKRGQKPSVEQRGELLWFSLAGGKSAVVRSVEEAVEFLQTNPSAPQHQHNDP